jgi:hypothetical protein
MDPPFGIGVDVWDSRVDAERIKGWLDKALEVCTNKDVLIFICADLQLSWKIGAALESMGGAKVGDCLN